MLPFENHIVARSVSANDVVPIPLPARNLVINKIVIKQLAATDNFTADILNRAVTNPVNRILKILDNGSTLCLVKFALPHRFRIQDRLTLASTGVAGYNTTHIVTSSLDAYTIITDQAYTADASAGTATLIMPLAGVSRGPSGFARFTTVQPCLLKTGDLITIASMTKVSDGTSATYNTTHYVRDTSEFGFDVYTDYAEAAVGGTVAVTHGSLLDPWRVGAALTAVSGLAASYDTFGRNALLQDVRRESAETPFLHIKLSHADSYHIAIGGYTRSPD